MNKYKIRIIKRYDFELEGNTETDVTKKAYYMNAHPEMLTNRSIKKTLRVKVKKMRDSEANNEKDN